MDQDEPTSDDSAYAPDIPAAFQWNWAVTVKELLTNLPSYFGRGSVLSERSITCCPQRERFSGRARSKL